MKKIFLIVAIFFLFIILANSTSALDIKPDLKEAGQGAEYNVEAQNNPDTIPNMIGQIVRIILSFVGALFFIFIIASGMQWMTAGGNEEKVTKARTRLVNASIGLAITVAAYFITWFISNTLLQ